MKPCMHIDLVEISYTAIFPCNPDLDFSCSRSHSILCYLLSHMNERTYPRTIALISSLSGRDLTHMLWVILEYAKNANRPYRLAVFSAPEPKAQLHYCDHMLSIVRPSGVNFSHFRLLLWNRWTEFCETWQEAKTQHPLPSFCFSGWSEKQDGRPDLWLAETFSTSPLQPLNRIQLNFAGSKISTSSTKFVFFRPIRKTRWLPWPLIGWDIFEFSSETAEGNLTKLDKKQDLNVLYQVYVFWKIS